MIEISAETYRTIAAALRKKIGAADWFNGAIDLETEEFQARLIVTAIVYRRTETAPDAPFTAPMRPISDVVPVWWELQTVQEGGGVPNDFSFSELKPYLIDYD